MITFEKFKEIFKKKLPEFYFLNEQFHSETKDIFWIQIFEQHLIFVIDNSDLDDFLIACITLDELKAQKIFKEVCK